MKILYITTLAFENNSPASFRNISLINGLLELGHEVHLLSVEPNKNSLAYDSTISLAGCVYDFRIPLSDIYNTFTLKKGDKKNNIVSRLSRKSKEIFKKIYSSIQVYDGLKTVVNEINKLDFYNTVYDAIISSSDPRSSHLLAEKFISLYPNRVKKWIQYWGDPMYLDSTSRYIIPQLLKREENRLISKADRVVYVSPLTHDAQTKLYPSYSAKMKFIPPAYLKENIYENKPIGQKLLLGHYGSYNTSARNILPLYQAACDGSFMLELVGGGNIKFESKDNIFIKQRVPINEIVKMEQNVDVLVCLCNSSGTQIPSKVYNYAATNKPILVILDGNKESIKKYLQGYERYFFCNNNVTDIRCAVKNIVNEPEKVNNKPIKSLQPAKIAKKFIDDIL